MSIKFTVPVLIALGLAAAAPAYAKGHDQGVGEAQGGPFTPTDPGDIEDTKAGAQGLGEALPTVVPGGGFSGAVRQNGGD